jgi:hypothetical protein
MNVNAILATQAAQSQNTTAQGPQKASGGAAKTSIAPAAEPAAGALNALQTAVPPGKGAIQEQSQQQTNGSPAEVTTGTHVNLFA